jgi:hypothetical protein
VICWLGSVRRRSARLITEVAVRCAWRYLATQLGVLPEPAVPLSAVVIAIPAALVLANLIATAPGQAAARTQPATILRTE